MPLPSPRRGVLSAIAVAVVLLGATAGTVLADVPDTRAEIHDAAQHVDASTVCAFHLHFYSTEADPKEAGYWEIWSADGTRLLDGQFSVARSQPEQLVPFDGTYTLPNGTYQLRWDNEPVDRSHLEKDFSVDCPVGDAAASPSGAVAGVVGTPTITLPPTDVPAASAPATAASPALVVGIGVGLLALAGALLALTGVVRPRVAVRRISRDRAGGGRRG